MQYLHFYRIGLIIFSLHLLVGGDPIISTPYGQIQGLEKDKVLEFRGVPYAEPPVGSLRFEVTPLVTSYGAGVYDASFNRDGCLQGPLDGYFSNPDTVSEDCLYLTIRTPLPPVIDAPVMVWLHGGNFKDGSGQSVIYDGTWLANNTNVIVVGVNYRLSALGWGMLDVANIAGNMGLFDIIHALEWIQAAIAPFGGDPDKVTVFGQSAGGTAIAALLALPSLTTGLFHNAIMQSHPVGLAMNTRASANTVMTEFAESVGCGGAAPIRDCLNAITETQIINGHNDVYDNIDLGDFMQNFYKFTPVVDGTLITQQPFETIRSGQILDIPIIAGHTSEEAVLYINMLFADAISQVIYPILMTLLVPHIPVVDIYPASNCPTVDGVVDCRPLMAEFITDYLWICPMRNIIQGLEQQTNPQHASYIGLYRYEHAWVQEGLWQPHLSFCDGFVCHASELPFVFNVCHLSETSCTAGEVILSERLAGTWGKFALNGDPTGYPGVPNWATYSSSNDNYLVIDAPSFSTTSNLRASFCDTMDPYGYEPTRDKTIDPHLVPLIDLINDIIELVTQCVDAGVICFGDMGCCSRDCAGGRCQQKAAMTEEGSELDGSQYEEECHLVGDTFGVTCCSQQQGTIECHASTLTSDGTTGCQTEKTFDEASTICNTNGYRLCTLEELGTNICSLSSTGCDFDSERVWSLNTCEAECRVDASLCGGDDDLCCSTNCNFLGICEACVSEGSICLDSPNCCSDNCLGLQCHAEGQVCRNDGVICESDNGCCSTNCNILGHCEACVSEGSICLDSANCCSDNCRGLQCHAQGQTCSNIGVLCGSDDNACCSNNCNLFGYCEACMVGGVPCWEDTHCCSNDCPWYKFCRN